MLTRPHSSRPRPRLRPKKTRPRPRPETTRPRPIKTKTKTKTEKFGLKIKTKTNRPIKTKTVADKTIYKNPDKRSRNGDKSLANWKLYSQIVQNYFIVFNGILFTVWFTVPNTTTHSHSYVLSNYI